MLQLWREPNMKSHKHRRRSRCGKPENIAKRSEERTSLILACGHCKIWQCSQQEKKNTYMGKCELAHLCIHKCFYSKDTNKNMEDKKKKKEIAVITLGKEISHITEKTTKTNKNIKEKGQIATKIVLK